jgi:hypothetical protein
MHDQCEMLRGHRVDGEVAPVHAQVRRESRKLTVENVGKRRSLRSSLGDHRVRAGQCLEPAIKH